MAIKSVGQTNSAFFVEDSVDPTTFGGQFLSYNPETNSFEYVGYEEMLAQSSSDASSPQTVKDFFERGVGGEAYTSDLPDIPTTGTGGGSIHRAATGFSAFNTVVDVLTAPVDAFGLATTVYEGVTGFNEGMTRAEVFEQAQSPRATVADKLAAYQQKPSWTDYASDLVIGGLSLFTGQFKSALGAGLGLGSTVSAEIESDRALTEAGQLERLGYASGFTPAQVSGFSGYQQTIADFMAQQEANLQAAAVEETELASTTPGRDVLAATVGQALTGTTSQGGVTSASASAAYDVFGKSSGGSAAEQREAYAQASKGTSDRKTSFHSSNRETSSGDFGSSGYGGFSGGSGAGGFEGDIGGGGFGGFA